MRVLLVEDSASLCNSIRHGLERVGYAVDTVSDGNQAGAYIASGLHDVIVLDLMLPGRDGLTLLKEMRAAGNQTHVLILSAMGQVEDRIGGLELGADDYLIKPFAFNELKARVDALVRRRYQDKRPLLALGELRIDTAIREVCWRSAPLPLTANEYTALEALVRHQGQVLSRAQLIERTRDGNSEISDNAVEVLICGLRRKLAAAGAPAMIHTRRGFGYYVS